jgi:hypothetical protein
MSAQVSLIAELEDAIKSGSSEKRVETLRRVTDLFLNDADRLNEAQIGLFDEAVTDVLLERGDRETVHRLARNATRQMRGRM